MVRIIVHVGCCKTGTTFLQQVFDRLPNVRCIGRPNHVNERYERFIRTLTGDIADQTAAAEIRDYILGPQDSDGQTIILSDEMISMAPTQHAIARRLAMATEAKADILITARNQVDAIKSFYANHGRILKDVPRSFPGQHVLFEDWFDFALDHYESSYLRSIDYTSLAQIYEQYLPQGATVLLFEDMIKDRDRYAARIADFLGVDTAPFLEPMEAVNIRDSHRRAVYQSVRTRFARGRSVIGLIPGHQFLRAQLDRFLDRGPGLEVDIDPERMQKIQELYGESNRELSGRLQSDLTEYGYPLR